MNLKDLLTDDELEALEKTAIRNRRNATKYGHLLGDDK